MPLLGREAGTRVFRDLDENPGDETFPSEIRRLTQADGVTLRLARG